MTLRGDVMRDNVIRELASRGYKLEEDVVIKGRSRIEHKFDLKVNDSVLVDIAYEVNEMELLKFYVKLYDVNYKGFLIVKDIDEKALKLAKGLKVTVLKYERGLNPAY